MSINTLHAGAGPVSSTTGLDNVGFSPVAEGKYNKPVEITNPKLARLLGVQLVDGKATVNVANQSSVNALNLLNGMGDDFHGEVYSGTPSWAGRVGDFLWGTKIREE